MRRNGNERGDLILKPSDEPVIEEALDRPLAKKSFAKKFSIPKFEPALDKVSKPKEAISNVPSVSLDHGAIDFKALLSKAVGIIQEQSLVGQDPASITLKSMELSKAKANSLLEALHNIVLVTHTSEILSADSLKFKRAEEMGVLKPLLTAFNQAAQAGEKSMIILVKKLTEAEENMKEVGTLEEEETKARILNYMQEAYGACIDNLNKIVAGTARLVQLERFSQGRPWGAVGVSRGNMGYIEKLDPESAPLPDAGAVGATPARPLTREEIEGALKNS